MLCVGSLLHYPVQPKINKENIEIREANKGLTIDESRLERNILLNQCPVW